MLAFVLVATALAMTWPLARLVYRHSGRPLAGAHAAARPHTWRMTTASATTRPLTCRRLNCSARC